MHQLCFLLTVAEDDSVRGVCSLDCYRFDAIVGEMKGEGRGSYTSLESLRSK